MEVEEAKNAIIEFLEKNGLGKKAVNYKLRDWIFARQRYWGEPIPVVHCDDCGVVPVPYDQLPVELPDVESYKPTADGSSPLAAMTDWVNTACPACGKPARRETDTMPQWAGSSWYFIRYPDKHHTQGLVSPESLKNWLPVDMYVGGIEHAVLHLLYARFWTKFLFDEKIIPFNEPFVRLFNQGMVVRRAHRCHPCNRWVYDAEIDFSGDGRDCPDCGSGLEVTLEKMSKSKGNGVSPDHLVETFGADSLRLYELFAGDPALDSEWNDDGLKACHNLLKRSWNFLYSATPAPESSMEAGRAINRLVKNAGRRILSFKFNTAVSAIMEFINDAVKLKNQFSANDLEKFVVVLSPFAPHFAEEVWHSVLKKSSHVFHQKYPEYDENLLQSDTVEYAVQINGKVRMKIAVPSKSGKEAILEILRADEKFNRLVDGKAIRKVIHVPGRLINFIA